jgi:hypothetical protein
LYYGKCTGKRDLIKLFISAKHVPKLLTAQKFDLKLDFFQKSGVEQASNS